MNTLYLTDKEFLRQLDISKQREIFARITALTFNEDPIESIEGRITGGSVNLDGNSAVRRTCNLTMTAPQVEINMLNWATRTKFKLEIGLINTINSIYPNLCWFPLGKYVINSFTTSKSVNNISISISGKDKMCLLNGELGGNLPATIDFGKEEEIYYNYIGTEVSSYQPGKYYYQDPTDNKKYILDYSSTTTEGRNYYVREVDADGNPIPHLRYNKLTLFQIIKEGVHTWAREPYSNIIINNLDQYGLQQLTYKGDETLFLLRVGGDGANQGNVETIYYDLTQNFYIQDGNTKRSITLQDALDMSSVTNVNGPTFFFEDLTNMSSRSATTVYLEDVTDAQPYYLTKIEYGQDAGYRITPLVFNDDLISSIGEAFTSILDKIKNMLGGDFEYFYNLDGQFIFQQKRTYINQSWSAIQGDELDILDRYVENAAYTDSSEYDFINEYLITALNNNPTLANLKNDYSIWGERSGITGTKIPIHARYVFDSKPEYYKSVDGSVYMTQEYYNKCMQANNSSGSDNLKIRLVQNNTDVTNDYYAACRTKYNDLITWLSAENNLTTARPRDMANNLYIADNLESNLDPDDTTLKWPFKYAKWWDLHDWIQFYTRLTGSAPSESLFKYNSGYYRHKKDESYTEARQVVSNTTAYPYYQIKLLNHPRPVKDGVIGSDRPVWLFLTNNITGQSGQTSTFFFLSFSAPNCDNDILFNNHYPYHIDSNLNPVSCYDTLIPGGTFNYCINGYTLEESNITNCHIYIYNPQLSPTEGGSLADYIRKKVKNDSYSDAVWYINDDPTTPKIVDWREIIYQMAKDYRQYSNNLKRPEENKPTYQDSFTSIIGTNNPEHYPSGITGYEPYYVDIEGFWRQLYNPTLTDIIIKENNTLNSNYFLSADEISALTTINPDATINLQVAPTDAYLYWNTDVFFAPEKLNFWFDFYDQGELMDYSVKEIGLRSKVVNDNQVSAVYFKKIPNIIYVAPDDTDFWTNYTSDQAIDKSAYTFINIPKGMENAFSLSVRTKSAKDEIDNLIYQYAYIPENISITSLPIYYLQPNTRISISDDKTHIHGEYIVTRLTVPLTYNGTMSITANKAPERIY